jgi:hypothetical protein
MYYRPKKNGTPYIEMKPNGGALAPPGNEAPERWTPYKLWVGDLWECRGCGNTIVIGALNPASQDYLPNFDAMIVAMNPKIKVNDC